MFCVVWDFDWVFARVLEGEEVLGEKEWSEGRMRMVSPLPLQIRVLRIEGGECWKKRL